MANPAVRRPAAAAAPPPPQPEGVNFGSDSFYAGAAFVPDGDYCLFFDVRNHQGKDTNVKARLGVMAQAYPLSDPKAEPLQQFYSMGSGADKSFVPSPSGTGLVPIPGAPAFNLNDKTNWNMLRSSMLASGAPEFGDDISLWNGVWVHVTNVPEPAERKGFGGAATGEVQQEQRNRTVPVVSEIYPDGQPWAGTGGVPEVATQPSGAAPAPAPARMAAPAARPAAAQKVNGAIAAPARMAAPRAVAAAPVQEAEPEMTDEDVQGYAINGVAEVLSNPKYQKGTTKAILRVETLKNVSAMVGDAAGTAVIDTHFATDAVLGTLLASVGYGLKGLMVVPLPG